MKWLSKILQNRRLRRMVEQLAPIAMRLLTHDRTVRQIAEENIDAAFDQAVKLAAHAAGYDKLVAEEIRLVVAEIELRRAHHQLLREKARHDAELARIKAKYAR